MKSEYDFNKDVSDKYSLRGRVFHKIRNDILNGRYQEHEELKEIRIGKVKRFEIKPMYVEDACVQMDLLGHSFYVFINAETDQVNVVYRRKKGDYGLIEPEY